MPQSELYVFHNVYLHYILKNKILREYKQIDKNGGNMKKRNFFL